MEFITPNGQTRLYILYIYIRISIIIHTCVIICHIFRARNSWGISSREKIIQSSLRAAVALPGQSPHARLDEIGSWAWRHGDFLNGSLFEAFKDGAKHIGKP